MSYISINDFQHSAALLSVLIPRSSTLTQLWTINPSVQESRSTHSSYDGVAECQEVITRDEEMVEEGMRGMVSVSVTAAGLVPAGELIDVVWVAEDVVDRSGIFGHFVSSKRIDLTPCVFAASRIFLLNP